MQPNPAAQTTEDLSRQIAELTKLLTPVPSGPEDPVAALARALQQLTEASRAQAEMIDSLRAEVAALVGALERN
jgi:hypothetical protein